MRSDALEQSGGPDRSRYLALAADAAWRDGQSTVAESLRLRLLRVEPGHPAGRFPDWATAARSSDMLIFNYLTAKVTETVDVTVFSMLDVS